ncbi:hypothetical protein DPEC_G00124120 [Dallia pectoralis]|uniref:Uncharacterized protein n=1 Tax=Dallia pectoralis TaxID=75939 RepID=A0ACC2GRJ7_DALPE|nr:hypothetical protein DPEC_G00124120 [Dallia pectoralis]
MLINNNNHKQRRFTVAHTWTDNAVKNHWNSTIRRKAELGEYTMDEDGNALVLPTTLEQGEMTQYSEALAPRTKMKPATSKMVVSPPHLIQKRFQQPRFWHQCIHAHQLRQKSLTEAVLHMIAEDMLPLSFVEGSGFRSFMSVIGPQYPRLSQRTVGLRLYDDVEKTIKPHLIRDLKTCLVASDAVVHATLDLWASPTPTQLSQCSCTSWTRTGTSNGPLWPSVTSAIKT